MMWRVGQKIAHPDQQLAHCFVISSDNGSIFISCPEERIVVCGRQRELEKLGWIPQKSNSALIEH